MAGKVFLGKKSYGDYLVRGDISNVYVGNYTSIAQGVIFDCGFHHNVKAVSTYPFQAVNHKYDGFGIHPISKGDIHVGNDCWIGEGALIMSGVMIGDGAIIGCKAVVTKSVSPYEVVAGIPAKHIKFRFDPDSIRKLLKIKWWNWDEETIEKYVPSLVSNNIYEFIAQCAIMDTSL